MKKSLLLIALCAAAAQASAEPRTYKIDPSHTYPSFEADHMGISVWRGKFNKSSGMVTLDKEQNMGSVEIEVDLKSVDFGQDALNKVAVGKELFETAKFPKATYSAKLVDWVNGAPTRAEGMLTLHGETHPVTLKLTLFKCIMHPMLKRELCGADAYGTFQRDQFGMAAGKDYGFNMDVNLRIQVEAIATK